MKTREITLNKTYTDGKDNRRIVIATGPDYVLYPGQTDRDNLRYRVVARGKRGVRAIGFEGNSTRNSFASWAESEVVT